MEKVIVFLDGNKTFIASIALLIIPFLASQGIISTGLASLLASIIGILMGGGKLITNSAIKNESNLGVSITNNRVRKANK